MRGRKGRRLSVVVVAVMSVVLGITGIGIAQSKKGTKKGKIVADSGQASRKVAKRLAHSIANPKYARSAAFAARPPYGRVAAISTKRLGGFPLRGKSFMILSNGDALLAGKKNTRGDSGMNAGGPAIRGARDVTIFRMNMRVPKGRNCLSVRFKFLTEEFPEFIGEEFNDAFILELDRTTWDTRPVGDPRIRAPRNFATDLDGNMISVNSTGAANVTAARAKGTTYDGATRRLRASTKVRPGGRHRLYMSIFDQGDRQYDSAVFVDRLTYTKDDTCASGAVVDK